MHHSANDIDDLDEELKSKSEIKREMQQLQNLAEKIVKLSKHQRAKLPLTEELKDAMILADKIQNKHEALRRHIRYIAKILSGMDLQPLQQAFEFIENKHQQETLQFHFYEQLRDDLLTADNSTIEALIADNATLERQKLRQLIRMANKEKTAEKPAKYYRELFQYLKANVQVD